MKHTTLYIHAGGPKTGTSSIQSFLGSIASHLKNHDWSYEHSPDKPDLSLNTCGNGLLLYELLTADDYTPARLNDLLLRYCGGCHNAICSSEYLSGLTPTHWKELDESSRRLNITVNVIYYVRDVIPFLLSAYDQHVKNHYERRSFDDWVENADFPQTWQHATALRDIQAVFPKSSIHVIHYTERSRDIIESFVNLVGLGDIAAIDRAAINSRLNRSLTAKERKLLLAVNRASIGLVGKAARSKELADLLIHSQPHLEGESDACNSASLATLTARFGKDVDWINDTFFCGNDVISVFKSSDKQNSRETIATTDCSTESVAFEWAVDEFTSIHTRAQHDLLNHLNAIAENYARNWRPILPNPNIPSDFDVIAYVLLNRDVLLAGLDPVMHFIAHGMSEGRSYSFHEKQASTDLENNAGAISREPQEREPREAPGGRADRSDAL